MNDQWKVLLIGGSSATGKSHLTRQLADVYKHPLTEVDDIRIALQQVVDRKTHPDLYFFLDNPNHLKDYSANVLVEKLFSVGEEVWPSLDALITKHIICQEPVIFEGDGIIPGLLAKRDLTNIKAIFIYDTKENLKEREIKRSRGGKTDPETLDKQLDFSSCFGYELKKQSEEYGFLVVSATPLDTLFERVKEILEKEN